MSNDADYNKMSLNPHKTEYESKLIMELHLEKNIAVLHVSLFD